MLVQDLRRWADIGPTLAECLVFGFAGLCSFIFLPFSVQIAQSVHVAHLYSFIVWRWSQRVIIYE